MKTERYQILIRGVVDEGWSAYFSGMTLRAEPNGVTRLCGEIADQSGLHGLLNKIRDLNLRLISVQLLDSDGITPVECGYCPQNKPANTSFGR